MTDWTIILRSLAARRFSTLVTILSVAIGVALMLTLLSMRDAGRQAFTRGSGNMHLLISGDQSPLVAVLNSIFYANAPSRAIPYSRFQDIATDPRVEWAVPTQLGDNYQGLPVVGTTDDIFTKFRPTEDQSFTFAEGKAFSKDYEVVLGADAARETGRKLGDKLNITHGAASSRESGTPGHVHEEFMYTVVGILARSGTVHDRALFTNLNSAWSIHAWDRQERARGGDKKDDDHHHGGSEPKVINPPVELTEADRLITGIYVRAATRPGMVASAAVPQIGSQLRRESGFTVASPVDEIVRLFRIIGNIDQILLAMALVVMVSGGISIMLALYNSMAERRRQIAVLRVLGCSQSRVFNLVLTESALIAGLGAIAGVVLATLGAFLVASVLKARLGLVIRPVFSPEWILAVLIGTILIGAAAGLIPALVAYRTSVAKNLKPIG